MLALVNLSRAGLVTSELGELMDRRYADPNGVVATIARNRGVAVGVKIRAGAHIIGTGRDGWDNLRDAVKAARESKTWLMVHIGECPMSIPELVNELSPGDVLTHCFKGGTTRVTDDHGRIFDDVRAARERGVEFDVGHGYGSFHWEIVDAALEQGLEPTTISTDLHAMNLHGPVFDMPTTMSKFLMLGVPIERVVAMSTTNPAKTLGLEDQIGTLKVGTVADIRFSSRSMAGLSLRTATARSAPEICSWLRPRPFCEASSCRAAAAAACASSQTGRKRFPPDIFSGSLVISGLKSQLRRR